MWRDECPHLSNWHLGRAIWRSSSSWSPSDLDMVSFSLSIDQVVAFRTSKTPKSLAVKCEGTEFPGLEGNWFQFSDVLSIVLGLSDRSSWLARESGGSDWRVLWNQPNSGDEFGNLVSPRFTKIIFWHQNMPKNTWWPWWICNMITLLTHLSGYLAGRSGQLQDQWTVASGRFSAPPPASTSNLVWKASRISRLGPVFGFLMFWRFCK